MNPEEIKKNYHSYIDQIKDPFDQIVLKMRSQKGESWRGIAWKGPITQLIGYTKHFKTLAAIKWATLPIIGSSFVAVIGWYKQLPIWSLVLCSGALLFLIYYVYVRIYIGKMATLGHPEFHVEALKATRPDEYKLWQHFIQKDDFTFNGLYTILNTLLVPQPDNSINNVIQYSKAHEEQLLLTIQAQKERIEEFEQTINSIMVDVDIADNAIDYLVHLIADITTNLYRLTNNVLDFYDLRFITPFTIYNLKDNVLRKIKDIGTSGISPGEIDITAPGNEDYAAVIAARSKANEAFMNNPYPGRYIVAFKMQMLEGEEWVFCFHFDTSDERALSLLLSNDIIEARQIRRLVHGFCLILHGIMISKKEAAQYVAEKAN
ncbi:hypothetical protein ACFQ88_22415 [Paenibacillus sp. NPDC056579]|uniref:hypothetical protein n=1 Tax=Paenibacillus sp. NPDC056579 TaxID=3345871 RepID=UPI0036A8CEC0